MFRDGDDLYERIREHHASKTTHCVFVDEAQFLQEEQVWQLARVADRLHIPVMCYGLRTDFQGNLFSGSQALLALADEMREVRTICRCGRKATMVVRIGPDGKVAREGDQVAIGKDAYVSLCRRHWEEEMGRVAAEDLVGFSVGEHLLEVGPTALEAILELRTCSTCGELTARPTARSRGACPRTASRARPAQPPP